MGAPLQSWSRSPLSLSRLAAGLRSPHRLRAAHASPAPRSACRSRYRVPSGSRPGDVAPWRYRPQPAIASRCTPAILVALTAITPCRRLAIAADPATSRPASPASPPAPHPPRRAPATRRTSPCRAGSAAVPVIPAKWCGDTIAHTRKLRF